MDEVIIFDEDTPLELIKKIKPDVLCKGGDWSPSQIVGGDFVIDNGGEVKSLTFKDGHSTIISLIKLKKPDCFGWV